tara:strand:+ start:424 stop:933 length:510 start_codon:yes stop_codon:yes gene_type:complete
MKGERELTAEELQHWQEAVGQKRPKLDLDAFTAEVARDKTLRQQPRAVPALDPLIPGEYANIDTARKRRVRRGHHPIDAGIDLHGLNAEEAYVFFKEFIHAQSKQGARMVLVITGKGKYQEGRLRNLLPRWVNEPDLRPWVLSIDQARPQHGGGGAFYLLLKQAGKLRR